MKSIKSHITQLLKSLNEGVFEKEHTIALSLLSDVYKRQALGSVVHGDMNGVQITGLANLAGGTMRGVQLAGISNISGNNTVGLSAAGLVNITGDRTQGVIISGLTSIGGDKDVYKRQRHSSASY